MIKLCVDEGCPQFGTAHVCVMTVEEFIEHVRIGIIAGAYDMKWSVMFINRHGWATTRDVPPDKRFYVLRQLTRQANR